jgi:hypothetical protein
MTRNRKKALTLPPPQRGLAGSSHWVRLPHLRGQQWPDRSHPFGARASWPTLRGDARAGVPDDGSSRVLAWTESGTLAVMKFTVDDLVATLAAAREESYVRVVADWLAHGEVAPAGPALTGRPVVDALVAAGTAHLARLNETEAPAWTQEPTRSLPSFWHPGSDRFFAYSLAHAPAEFAARGILVEQDSLVSV